MKASNTVIIAALLAGWSAAAYAEQLKTYFYSGTGFFVNQDGYAITNAHVVKDCQRILLQGPIEREARLVALDKDNDLALLQATVTMPDVATFSSLRTPLTAGQRVVIVGYPGEAFRTAQTVTREGQLVAALGPRGESKWLQLTNIIERGNSGGPLFDQGGNVIGIVSAHAEIYTYYTDAPQNGQNRQAGIAISLPVIEQFLSSQGISFRQSDAEGMYSADRITDMAHRFTVNVRCEYKTERLP